MDFVKGCLFYFAIWAVCFLMVWFFVWRIYEFAIWALTYI